MYVHSNDENAPTYRRNRSTRELPDWRSIRVSLPNCPACGQAVEDVQWVGPITLALEPCGHHVDDHLYGDFQGDESAC